MPPLQAFYLISTVVIFAVGWMRGGHVERRAVALLLIAYVASVLAADLADDRYLYGEMIIDLVLLVVIARLALTHDRWWLLLATAGQVLTLVAHASVVIDPGISLRDNVATRWVFGLLVLYSLLGGVLERWLAGEPAAMGTLRPRRPQTTG